MKAEGIPAGTDDPLLLALGAKPLDGDHAAVRDECEVALSIPFDQRNITHGDAFYEAVLRLIQLSEEGG